MAIRVYRGCEPDPKHGWRLVGEIDAHVLVWRLHCRATEGDWLGLKLSAVGEASYKANFWLAYHSRERRFAKGKDFKALTVHRPELAGAILRLLVDAHCLDAG